MDDAVCTFPSQNPPSPAWRDYDKLRKAVRSHNTDLVRSLIENGAHVNQHSSDYSENTPLHLAVISRCLEIAKILLDKGADIDVKNALWDTPLTMAAKMENMDMVDLILSHTVRHCCNDKDGLSHLHIACMRNNLGVVRKLVLTDHGKSINEAVGMESIVWSGFTPLHFAAYYGCVETVGYLLKCGADIMAEDSKKFTPVHWADLHREEKIIDLLLTASKNEFKTPVGSHGLTQFHIACTRDDPSVVEHFLKLGVSINLEVQSSVPGYWRGWKPIHLAMYYECPKVIELLLNFKADYDISPICRCPSLLLEYAFVTKNEPIYNNFTICKEKRGDSYKEIEKYPKFHLACINNDGDFVLEWLQKTRHSRLNEPIGCGLTPLHLAVKYDSIDALKLLLAWDADFTVQDSQGKTPVHTAFDKGYFAYIYKIAEDFTDDTPNVTDHDGLSFLHILCSTDSPELVKSFLSRGYDVNAKVGDESPLWAGSTPMDFACEFEWEDNVKKLLKYKSDIYIKNDSIFDHFNLLFEDMDEEGELEDFQELLFKNLMAAISSPFMQIKYTNHGISPLHALCANPLSKIKVLKRYLRTHADEINQAIEMPQSRKFHKYTPLHLAMQYHDFEKAKVLLKAGADPLLLNGAGNTPIECAFPYTGPLYMSDEEAKCLFPFDMAVESIQPSLFFVACCAYRIDFVKHVLMKINDPILKDSLVNCRNSVNQTPLHHLVLHDDLEEYRSDERREMMKLLLDNGADVDAENHLLWTPLLLTEKKPITDFLIDHGADVNAQNIHGRTCLHVMCRNNDSLKKHSDRIALLLENGANINIEDQQGRTCLTLIESFIQNDRSLKRYVIPLLKHVKKLAILGLHVSQKNEDAYSEILKSCDDVFNESNFESECNKELGIMSQKNIDQYTTVRDIVLKSVGEMTHYCQNDVLQSLFESVNKDLPIYGPLIKSQIKKGRIRQPLLQNSKKSLIFLCKVSLPQICLELILQHLSNKELRHFIRNVGIIEIASMTNN